MSGVEAQGDAEQLIVGGVAVELRVLSEQLQKLQEEIRKYDAGAAAELERLRSAQQAASRGDAQATALSLKGIGRWVGDFAAQVGAILVAEVIKKQSGL